MDLRSGVPVDLARLERHFYTTSSCGVCGKASLEAVRVCSRHHPPDGHPVFDARIIHQLPENLRTAQTIFDRTGGLHAAALFNVHGQLLDVREDVGRHNAVDKLLGAQLRSGRTPLYEDVLLVSGRVSFELVQRRLSPVFPCSRPSVPSSLAVDLAREQGLTVPASSPARRLTSIPDKPYPPGGPAHRNDPSRGRADVTGSRVRRRPVMGQHKTTLRGNFTMFSLRIFSLSQRACPESEPISP